MIVDYIQNHQAEFWVVLGFILLSIEVSTGLVTGILLFASIGSIITGLLILVGILPETWEAGITSTAICSSIATLILWKPLKGLQDDNIPKKNTSSDLIGYEFTLEQDINQLTPGKTRYSGIEWKVEIDPDAGIESISASRRVKVSLVDVGKFYVKPV